MENLYNVRNPAVKRLFREAQELKQNPDEDFHAAPLEDNLFEWHFTVRGPADTAFENGLYHGRIILPPEYPMKPPNIIILTPNGRFETNTKICLSISGYHPETWQPSWSIRTALKALIGFMPTPGAGAIGSLDLPDLQRKELAQKSHAWTCPQCLKTNKDSLASAADDSVILSGDTEVTAITLASKTANPFDTFSIPLEKIDLPSRPAPPSPESASGDNSEENRDFPQLPPRPRTSSFQSQCGRGSGKHAHFADEPSPPIIPPTFAAVSESAGHPYTFPPRPESNKQEMPNLLSATKQNSSSGSPQPGTALTSASTEEMRSKQAFILKERQKLLHERMTASGTTPPAALESENPSRTLRTLDASRIESSINSLRQTVFFIAVCLMILVFRRLLMMVDDENEPDMEF